MKSLISSIRNVDSRGLCFVLLVSLIIAFVGAPRSENLGMPINSNYYDYLFFAGVLDNSKEFVGTVFLDMAERLSSISLLINVSRALAHAGMSYVLQAALFSLVGNTVAIAGILYISLLLTRSVAFSIIALLITFDYNIIFKYHVLSSTLANQFSLLAVAFLLGAHYRLAGAITGLIGLIHPAFPPIIGCFAITVIVSKEKERRGWQIGKYLIAAALAGIPYLWNISISTGDVFLIGPSEEEWISFVRGVNGVPFPAMNSARFTLICLTLATNIIVFARTAKVELYSSYYRALSALFALGLLFVIIQGSLTALVPFAFIVKLCLHHRVLPTLVPLMLIGFAAVAFIQIVQFKRIQFLPLLLGLIALKWDPNYRDLFILGSAMLFLLSLNCSQTICKPLDFIGSRLLVGFSVNHSGPTKRVIKLKESILFGLLIAIAYLMTDARILWILPREAIYNWRSLFSGKLSRDKASARNDLVQSIAVGDRLFVVPLKEGGMKFFSVAPERSSFLESVEMTYILYVPEALSNVKRKLEAYGHVDWDSNSRNVSAQLQVFSQDGWLWRQHIGLIKEIDPRVKYVITYRKFTCIGEPIVMQKASDVNRGTDTILIRLSDAIDLHSCKKWQEAPQTALLNKEEYL